ncbi:TIGR04282 family arsenosugar biosynthesis glycosyltransferase [Primorskyibacter sp. S87]|uniref:TIGR04282 family arsenosugar biosynthesis glycosyltransferase n=1 Tax=Primorskyibacter sp. S87 TaxID=3415126 RepID=UPI003C7C9DF9
MVKEPRPGRVKTRLAKDFGTVPAAWWFRRQARNLLQRLRDPRWEITLAVAPDWEGQLSKIWPADLPRSPQGRGDLGQRMARQMSLPSAGPVCVIGADLPDLDRRHVANAFSALGRHDYVFGPAEDGGFWLAGAKRVKALPATLFRNVRWSSNHALTDTLKGLHGERIALIDTLRDVDTAKDLSEIALRRV